MAGRFLGLDAVCTVVGVGGLQNISAVVAFADMFRQVHPGRKRRLPGFPAQ
ncbi:hypothetical protein D3C87_1924790 [compost metagenome]